MPGCQYSHASRAVPVPPDKTRPARTRPGASATSHRFHLVQISTANPKRFPFGKFYRPHAQPVMAEADNGLPAQDGPSGECE